MDPFTAAMLVGTGLQIYGNYRANLDEARAEAQNQQWMREQQGAIKRSTARELDIYNRNANEQLAAMENTFAASGISMEGSAMVLRQQNELLKFLEIEAIVDQGNMQMKEAALKIGASQSRQTQLTSGTAIQSIALGIKGAGDARQVYLREKQNNTIQ